MPAVEQPPIGTLTLQQGTRVGAVNKLEAAASAVVEVLQAEAQMVQWRHRYRSDPKRHRCLRFSQELGGRLLLLVRHRVERILITAVYSLTNEGGHCDAR